MAMDIILAKKGTENGLLSKIQIGTKIYEIKDLIARESIEELAELIDALSAQVGEVEEGENLAELIAALEEAVKNLQDNKADKEQVAKDIKAAVDAEAAIARAAEKVNADAIAEANEAIAANTGEIEAINAILNTVDSEDNLTSLKELALWVEEHGEDAAEMSKSITQNAEDIKDLQEADKAAGERLDAIEEMLGEGEGSVADQIADAKEAAIGAAKDYTDGRETEITKAYKAADKAITDSLGAFATADTATAEVAEKTVSGVKATGTGVTDVTLADTANTKDITSTGKFTPAGNVAGTVTIAEHAVPVTVTNNDAQAVIATGTGVANASITVTPSTMEVITGIACTPATFTEGTFSAGKLDTEDITVAAHNSLTAEVEDDETLVFTAAMTEAITFKAVKEYVAPSKEKDSFTADKCEPQKGTVVAGIDSANASIEYEKVTGVTYKKAEENAAGTCAGSTVAINATFTGTEGAVSVDGQYTDTTYTAAATTGNIELNVGDIVVPKQTITVVPVQ